MMPIVNRLYTYIVVERSLKKCAQCALFRGKYRENTRSMIQREMDCYLEFQESDTLFPSISLATPDLKLQDK